MSVAEQANHVNGGQLIQANDKKQLSEANFADIGTFERALAVKSDEGELLEQAFGAKSAEGESLMSLDDVTTWADWSMYMLGRPEDAGLMNPAETAKYQELLVLDMIRHQGKQNEERLKELKKELGVS